MDKNTLMSTIVLSLCLIQCIKTWDLDESKNPEYYVRKIDSNSSIDQFEQNSIEFDTLPRPRPLSEETCETIQLAVVCGGFNAPRKFYVLIKSILFHRSTRIHLHLLVDNISRQILENLFKTWQVADLEISYYNATELEPEVSWIPSQHYSHRYGLMKLAFLSTLYEISNITDIVMMDTDMIVLGDIKELQTTFKIMKDHPKNNSTAALGMVENQSDWYLRSDSTKSNRNVWPAAGRGFNSGLILANLVELNRMNWQEIWRQVAELKLITHRTAPLADQDIFNAVAREYSYLVRTLPGYFNIQLNDHSFSKGIDMNQQHLRIIHWNSPHKLKTKNKLADHFNDWYSTFQDWSGRLLKQSPCVWQGILQKSPLLSDNRSADLDTNCHEIQPHFGEHLRMYLYFRDYELNVLDDEIGITIAVHLSIDRLQVLDELASHWRGQISAAIYLSEQDTSLLMVSIEGSKNLSYRRNIGYHLVFRDHGFNYPINRLRNVALNNVNTPYVFLSDIDLIPSNNLYDYLQSILSGMAGGNNGTALDGKALVVPVFENLLYKFNFPNSKTDLLTGINLGSISMFRDQIWPQGQAPTDYARWRVATRPYEVEWKPEYEPFIVTGRKVPRFDERFVGFGWNKVEHTMLLSAMGYKFIVLPEAFVIHKFHSPSYDIIRHRESARYRRCIMRLKKNFLIELHEKFPNFFSKLGAKMQL